MQDGLPSLPRPMHSVPFLMRLVAATLLARQNKTLIAEVTYLRAQRRFLKPFHAAFAADFLNLHLPN